jgi:hypothetical protein
MTPARCDTLHHPAPYPALPANPPAPAANATAVALWKDERDKYKAAMTGVAVICKAILRETCDETLRDELSGLQGGLAAQTLPLILAYLDHQFSVLAITDLRALAAQANNTRFTSTTSFCEKAAKLGLIFAKLHRQQQPFSNLQKNDILRKATSTLAPIVTAIQNYDRVVWSRISSITQA